jgi:hypothetical protein
MASDGRAPVLLMRGGAGSCSVIAEGPEESIVCLLGALLSTKAEASVACHIMLLFMGARFNAPFIPESCLCEGHEPGGNGAGTAGRNGQPPAEAPARHGQPEEAHCPAAGCDRGPAGRGRATGWQVSICGLAAACVSCGLTSHDLTLGHLLTDTSTSML